MERDNVVIGNPQLFPLLARKLWMDSPNSYLQLLFPLLALSL
jgi:hypothetical protein